MVEKYHPIAMGVSKKNVEKIKRELRKQGYSGFMTTKPNRYYNIYYKLKKKKRKS